MTLIVIDWGIGGLDTFARLSAHLPAHDLHYLSDSGFTPWGKVDSTALAARIRHILDILVDDLPNPHTELAVVVACNAASTVVDKLELPWPVFEVITPGVELLVRTAVSRPGSKLAVLGGARTIASQAHRRMSGKDLLELVAQPLSAHVEAGRLDGKALLADLRPLLEALEQHGCEATLLACTHYPALLPVLTREAPKMCWLDPVSDPESGLVAQVVRVISGQGGHRLRTYTTSGDPHAMRAAARAAFGLTVPLPKVLRERS